MQASEEDNMEPEKKIEDIQARRSKIVGVVMVVVAIAILAFSLFYIGEEENTLNKAAPFNGNAADTVKLGDLVIVTGKVSEKNKNIKFDFVHAAKEHHVDADWTILEFYRQPVIADLEKGEIILNSELLCTNGRGKSILHTDEKSEWRLPIRYEGLKRGNPIMAIGTITSLSPASLAVQHWYSGSVSDYRDSLASSKKNAPIFFVLLVGMGAGLYFWGVKRLKRL